MFIKSLLIAFIADAALAETICGSVSPLGEKFVFSWVNPQHATASTSIGALPGVTKVFVSEPNLLARQKHDLQGDKIFPSAISASQPSAHAVENWVVVEDNMKDHQQLMSLTASQHSKDILENKSAVSKRSALSAVTAIALPAESVSQGLSTSARIAGFSSAFDSVASALSSASRMSVTEAANYASLTSAYSYLEEAAPSLLTASAQEESSPTGSAISFAGHSGMTESASMPSRTSMMVGSAAAATPASSATAQEELLRQAASSALSAVSSVSRMSATESANYASILSAYQSLEQASPVPLSKELQATWMRQGLSSAFAAISSASAVSVTASADYSSASQRLEAYKMHNSAVRHDIQPMVRAILLVLSVIYLGLNVFV